MIEINNTTKEKINIKKTREIIAEFLRVYKKSNYDVSLAMVGANRLKTLNYKYRGLAKTTDVLSFKASAIPALNSKKFLGEVIINIAEIKKFYKYQEMFKELGLTFPEAKTTQRKISKRTQEKISKTTYLFYFLLVHGLLHLVGYNDNKEGARLKMLKLGRDFLGKML